MAERRTLRESFILPQGRPVREDVAAMGLDPELYLGVIEADFGCAGIVNMNRRVYPVADFRAENAALAGRIENGANGVDLVDAEEDHPDWNPTFKVPLAIVELRVDEDERFPGKAAISRGRVAFLNTTHGRDMLVLYKAGLRIGFSSRGTGWCEDHLIDESSPYWDANESYRNMWVGEVRGWKLETYDAVRVPSAGTFAKKNKENREAAEAYARLVEAGIVKPQETQMTLAELKKNHPELYEALLKEGKAQAEAGQALNAAEAKCKALETEVGTLKSSLSDAQGKVTAAEAKVGEAEKAANDAKAALKAAEEAKAAAEGKLAQKAHEEAMAQAFVESVQAAPEAHRKTVDEQLKVWLEANKTATVEQLKSTGTVIARAVEATAKATAAATAGTAPTEAADDDKKPKTGDQPPAPATESVEMVSLNLAIQRQRQAAGLSP